MRKIWNIEWELGLCRGFIESKAVLIAPIPATRPKDM